MFFLVGKSEHATDFNNKRINDLKSEIALHGDFIIGDYVDSYRNLTMKTFSDGDQ